MIWNKVQLEEIKSTACLGQELITIFFNVNSKQGCPLERLIAAQTAFVVSPGISEAEKFPGCQAFVMLTHVYACMFLCHEFDDALRDRAESGA